MAVITISREMGSGGLTIAADVAHRLGYEYVDKALIAGVAREAGMPEDRVKRFDEHDEHPVERWLRDMILEPWKTMVNPSRLLSFADAAGQNVILPSGEHALDRDEYHEALITIIERLWQRGDVVIVGRGSQCFLAGHANVLHVRIIAPLDVRCRRIMAQRNLRKSAAKSLINKTDQARARYLQKYCHIDWADPLMYQLVLNTGRLEVAETGAIIVHAVQSMAAARKEPSP